MSQAETVTFKANTTTPKFGPIDTWCALTGMGRRSTYDHLACGNLMAVKVGSRTLINIERGLEWLESLPRAQIKPQNRHKSFPG